MSNFESWWNASKYMQVVISSKSDEQIASDAWNAGYQAAKEAAQTQEHVCTRSHPHENMNAVCEEKTVSARLQNELAHANAQIAELELRYGELHENWSYMREQIAELRKENERLAESCRDFAAQFETDQGIIKGGGKEIHFLREQIAKLEQEVLTLTCCNKEIKEDTEAQIARLDTYIKHLTADAAALKPMSDEEVFELWHELITGDNSNDVIINFARRLGVPKP